MSDWQRTTLGEVTTQVSRAVRVEDLTEARYAGVRWHVGGVYHRETVPAEKIKGKLLYRIKCDDIVYNRMWATKASFGVVKNDADGCFVTNDFPVFMVKPDAILPEYVEAVFHTESFQSEAAGRAVGTTERRRLHVRDFANISVLLPPLPVQKRIVEVIGAVNDQITALDAEADVLDELWWALGREMATVVADEGTVPLASFCDISGGLTKNKKDREQPDLVEVPYLRVANVHRHHLNLSEVATIRTTRTKAEKLRLHPGDVLMNEGGDKDKLGRGHVWEGQIPDCIHQNHVFRVRVTDQRFDPYFVSAWGNTFGREWFETFGTQTTGIASINRSTLNRFPVPDVPLSVQQDWAGRLRAVVETMDSLRVQAASLRQVRAALLSGLLDRTINIESAEPEV